MPAIRSPRANQMARAAQPAKSAKAAKAAKAANAARSASAARQRHAPRIRPKRLGGASQRGKVLRCSAVNAANPVLNRLTVLWVQENGVPFDTTGFAAELLSGGTAVQTASFDRYGTVRFSRVRTLTETSYTIRVLDESGAVFRTRTIPAGVAAYAIIG